MQIKTHRVIIMHKTASRSWRKNKMEEKMIKVLFMMIFIAFGVKSSAAEYFSECCCLTPCGCGVQMNNGDLQLCCMGGGFNVQNCCLGAGFCMCGTTVASFCVLPPVSWLLSPVTCCFGAACCAVGGVLLYKDLE